jgi:hypothetical protein
MPDFVETLDFGKNLMTFLFGYDNIYISDSDTQQGLF